MKTITDFLYSKLSRTSILKSSKVDSNKKGIELEVSETIILSLVGVLVKSIPSCVALLL